MNRLLTTLFIALIALLMTHTTNASEEETDAPDISPALVAHLEDLEARTVELRGLEPLRDVVRVFPTADEVRDIIQALFDEQVTPEEVAAVELFYRAFGFVDDDFDLRTAYIDLLSDQVAGFYDTESRAMHVILMGGEPLGDRLPLLEQVTYVHEYVHALQDQHFDLEALRSAVPEGEIDQGMALLSLIEGDAVVMMTDFMLAAVRDDPRLLIEALAIDTDAAQLPASVPPIMEAELLTPYLAGQNFVSRLRLIGGWELVDAAFADPPMSMAQIFDVQKYIDGIVPRPVILREADALDDWTPAFERTLGVFYLSEYLGHRLSQRAAMNALDGWMGDRYALYQGADDAVAWLGRITWHDESARDEFERVFITDYLREDGADALTCGDDVAGVVCISAIGERDTLIAAGPTKEAAAQLIDSQR